MEFVDASDSRNLSIMLYGPTGTGKTVAASGAPGPILALNADGAGAWRFARAKHGRTDIREVAVTSRETLHEAFLYAREHEAEIQTVVLDSVAAIFAVVLEELTGEEARPSLPQYGDASTFLERYIRAYRELDMNVILIAHENVVTNDETGGVERFPLVSTSSTVLANKVMYPLDIVAYTMRADGDDGVQYVAQVVPGHGRQGKDRSGVLPDVVVLDLSDWLAQIAKVYARAAKTSKNGKPATAATAASKE